MKTKSIGLLLCVILVLPMTLFVNAADNNTDRVYPAGTTRNFFKNCYVEVTGEPSFMMKNFWFRPYRDDRAFVTSWVIQFDELEDSNNIAIYSEKNGEILWDNSMETGIWALRLILYRGIYTNDITDDSPLIVNLEGNALLIVVLTEG